MAAREKTLDDLFHDTLKDIYYAERLILRTLPKMARAATADRLREAFEHHREQTQGQIERLDQVFELLEKRAQGKTCDAIIGILDEGKEIMEEFADSPALDAGLISSSQAVEHYEITRYGTLKSWAEQLGMPEAAELLAQTLQEERDTDELLTEIAEQEVNRSGQRPAARRDEQRPSRGAGGARRASPRDDDTGDRERDERGRYTESDRDYSRSGGGRTGGRAEMADDRDQPQRRSSTSGTEDRERDNGRAGPVRSGRGPGPAPRRNG